MFRTESMKIRSLTKMFIMILMVVAIGFYAVPALSVYAGEEEDVVEGPQSVIIVPPDAEVIEDEETPLAAPEEPAVLIPPERPPLAVFNTWAFLNLLLTIVTGIIVVALFVNYNMRLKDDLKTDKGKANRHLVLRLIALAALSVAVILFATTQDMTLPMLFTDGMTGMHLIILAAVAVLGVLGFRKYEERAEA